MRNVAIVGAGLGGLSAAIHLRLRGHAVTVFEANATVGGRANKIQRDGFSFDTGPSLVNYPWVFEQLFAAAGKRLQDYVELLPVDPSVCFRWPDETRFQLSSDFTKLLAECERLEPGCGPALSRFLLDAGRKYDTAFAKLVTRNADNLLRWLGRLSIPEMRQTGIWRSLDSELGRFFRSRYIREALGSYGMYLGGSPFDLPGLFSILAYGELAYGLWLPRGGVYGLVTGIERLARELGVQIHTSCKVLKIESRDRTVTGLRLQGGSVFEAPIVASNVDVPTTDRELLDLDRPAVPRMTPSVITYYLGFRDRVPASMGHHTIYLPHHYRQAFKDLCNGGKIPAELPFYVSIASATDPSLAPPGGAAVFVLVPTPVISDLGTIDWVTKTARIKAEVLARTGMDPASIAFEEVWTPVDWQSRFGLFDGSAFGAAHTLFQMGPFRSRNWSKGLRGLYYVGAGTTPGTGMPMVVLSGKLTAERIASHEG